jgi:ectoine hydroxylase-related dioxygenase (phytanoyl-CoA dioxygenase family)
MCFIPGSHKLPVLEHMVAPHPTFNPIDCSHFDELQLTPEAKDAVDFSTAVSCPVPAGALTFWTPRTLHGSMPNAGLEPRRTLLLGASYEAVPAALPLARPWQQQMARSGALLFAKSFL